MTLIEWMCWGISNPWFHTFWSLLGPKFLPVNTFNSAACTTGLLVAICLMHVMMKIPTESQRHFSVERESCCSPGSREFSWKYLLELALSIISSTLITCSSSQSSTAHDLLPSDHSLNHLWEHDNTEDNKVGTCAVWLRYWRQYRYGDNYCLN